MGLGKKAAGDTKCQFFFIIVHLEIGTSNHLMLLKPQPVLLSALWLKLPVKYSCVISLNPNISFHVEGEVSYFSIVKQQSVISMHWCYLLGKRRTSQVPVSLTFYLISWLGEVLININFDKTCL